MKVPARLAALLIGMFAGVPAPTRAQAILDVVVTPPAGPGYVARVDPDGPRLLSVRTLRSDESAWASGAATSEGRFIVAGTSELLGYFPQPVFALYLVVHDLVSGSTTKISQPQFPVVAAHPRRTEVITSDSRGPVALGVNGPRALGGCGTVGTLSADGSRAVFQCLSGVPVGYGVVDVDAGGVVADLGVTFGSWPVLDGDGRHVYDFDGAALRRRLVATGVELGRATIPGKDPLAVGTAEIHPWTKDVIVSANDGLHVVDPVTLALKRSQPSFWGGRSPGRWVLDPERPRLYVPTYGLQSTEFWVIDSDTLQVVSRTIVPAAIDVRLRRVPTPTAPTRLSAAVNGGAVTLSWSEGPVAAQTLRYVLEAGSAPGLSDIVSGLHVGAQTSLSAGGVPPGRYYVRVRAGNYAGLSGPSNEVVVQVP